ncbi:MAG: site-specific integrase [Elusimicrobia bacterium]|nr:site-specific integrase [Elusimicrobiota bacterium]
MPSVRVFLGETDFRRTCQVRVMPFDLLGKASEEDSGGLGSAMKKKIGGRVVPRGVIVDGGRVYTRLAVAGKIVKKSFGSLKDPNALAAAVRAANRHHDDKRLGRQGLERPAEHISVERACEIYWEHHASKKPTAGNYGRALRHFKGLFGARPLDSMTYLDVQNYRVARERDGLSPSSINREHTVLTHLFNSLRTWRRLKVIPNLRLPEGNPGSEVRKVGEKQFRRKRVLSPEEFDQFMKSSTVQVRRACLAAVLTGLRRKDLQNLTVDTVNEPLNLLQGVQAKTGKPYSVPIVGAMREIIETAPGRNVLDFTNFRKAFEQAKARAGLKVPFQFRDLRRTAARMMLAKGADLATVSAYLGHTTISMTEAYVQAEREHKQIAGEILGSLYRAPAPDQESEGCQVSESADFRIKVSALLSDNVEKVQREIVSKTLYS